MFLASEHLSCSSLVVEPVGGPPLYQLGVGRTTGRCVSEAMEASAAGARAHRSVRAGQAVRVCLLVSLPMLELPVFSEGVWGGKRALRWDVGVWWGTGVRWDPSHVEGTGMSWDHGWFAASNPGHVLWVGAGGGPTWRSGHPLS